MIKQDASLIDLEDADALAEHITEWHTRAFKLVKQLQEVPEDTEMTVVYQGKEATVKLSGEAYEAFLTGVMLVAMIFEDLPFVAIDEDALRN